MSLLAINVRRVIQYKIEDHIKGLLTEVVSLFYILFVMIFGFSQTMQTQIKVAR